MKLVAKSGLELRHLGDEGILLDPESGVFYRLSPLALRSWETLVNESGDQVDQAYVQEFQRLGIVTADGQELMGGFGTGTHLPQHDAPIAYAACSVVGSLCTGTNNKGQPCQWNPSGKQCQ